MTTDYKPLGQAAPAAATWVDLYTAPTGKQAVISTLSVCNTTTAGPAFSIAVRVAGATLATKHRIVMDSAMDAKQSVHLTIGMTLGPGDVLSVYSDLGGVAFTAFGSEVY